MAEVGTSTQLNVAKVLMIVGLVTHWFATVLFLGGGAFVLVMPIVMSEAPGILLWFGLLYLVLGAVTMAGAILGQRALSKAAAGDPHGAGVTAVIASLLPPVNTWILVAAVLYLVSPEAKTPPHDEATWSSVA